MMDKRTFKTSFNRLLEEQVDGIPNEKKIKYMKKWIKEYEQLEQTTLEKPQTTDHTTPLDNSKKVGELVRTTLDKIIRKQLLNSDRVRVLQDARHCKNLFDINYPLLKKVTNGSSLLEQRLVNGYSRFWANPITINNEKYLVCNDWYERNKTKFIKWAEEL
ncbi:hypothetical protein [Mesobacillus subterraneus]|uniref:Uncharacterized protein n=1 Tax=Mesobacillus subterraneus TaxID=285983 RepID=A0A427TW68_9BACI|nr:hypothetical protein [Mesobacillus subterraneus]RSD28586.1 hypothetical protein EJA10_03085 [Mesobacillus subterraneus]